MKTRARTRPQGAPPASGQPFAAPEPRGHAALDRALLALHSARDMPEFWEATRRVLRAALPLHEIWLRVRPFALLPATVFRDGAPFGSEAEFRLWQELDPLPPHLAARPGETLTRWSDLGADTELTRGEFHRHFMAPQEGRDLVGISVWREGLFQGSIELLRHAEQRDFSDADLRLLERLHFHFNATLPEVLALQRERAVRRSLVTLLANPSGPALLLDWHLRVIHRHRAASEPAAENQGCTRVPPEESADNLELPPAVRALCHELRNASHVALHRHSLLAAPQGIAIPHPVPPELRDSVTLLQLNAAPLNPPLFLVRCAEKRSSPASPPASLEALRNIDRLSVREREVALLIGRGCTNEEAAHQLGKSVLTVKKQLRSIYQKLAVEGRGRLIALLR